MIEKLVGLVVVEHAGVADAGYLPGPVVLRDEVGGTNLWHR